jgi:hypothetical protein
LTWLASLVQQFHRFEFNSGKQEIKMKQFILHEPSLYDTRLLSDEEWSHLVNGMMTTSLRIQETWAQRETTWELL